MSSITASLTPIPNGTIVNLDTESNLSWFRARGTDPWYYSAWESDFLTEPWGFVPQVNSQSLPVASCGGRFAVGVGPAGYHDGQIYGTDASGLIGHTYFNGRRNGDPVPARASVYPAIAPTVPAMRTDPAPPAFLMTGAKNGAELAVSVGFDESQYPASFSFGGRPLAIEADLYFWFRSGINLRWKAGSTRGSFADVNYDAAVHGVMVLNQLYRLRVASPTSTDPVRVNILCDSDSGTSTPAKVAFGCMTLRT